MGLIAGYLAFKGEASQPWRLFIMTGILGGYTTFSAFGRETYALLEAGEWLRAATNVVLSNVLALLAVWLGAVSARLVGYHP